MPKFFVRVAEVHNANYEVDAETKEDAINKIKDGAGDLKDTEYSYTMDDDRWEATQAD
jgi:hypothetical protein